MLTAKRFLSHSTQYLMPRLPYQPRKALPSTAPKTATGKQMKELVALQGMRVEMKSYPKPYPAKKTLPFYIRRTLPKEKRTLTDIIPPLPTTFAPGQTMENWRKIRLLDQSPREGEAHHHFPWRYYEIALMKSLIGMDKKVKYIAQSLGLTKRHQVVWRHVSPRSAGQILKLKELVRVRLVHEIPPKYTLPNGYRKVESMLEHAALVK